MPHIHVHVHTRDSFNEADHPRDGGKFTTKGGGARRQPARTPAHHELLADRHRDEAQRHAKSNPQLHDLHLTASKHHAQAAHLLRRLKSNTGVHRIPENDLHEGILRNVTKARAAEANIANFGK